MVDLSCEHCYLIENDLGRAGFIDLISLKQRESRQNGDCRRKKTEYESHFGTCHHTPPSGADGSPFSSRHFDHAMPNRSVSLVSKCVRVRNWQFEGRLICLKSKVHILIPSMRK